MNLIGPRRPVNTTKRKKEKRKEKNSEVRIEELRGHFTLFLFATQFFFFYQIPLLPLMVLAVSGTFSCSFWVGGWSGREFCRRQLRVPPRNGVAARAKLELK